MSGARAKPKRGRKQKRTRPWGRVFHPEDRPGWYVSFVVQGRKYRRAAGRTKAAARKKLAKVRQYLEDGAKLDDVLAHVFGDFVGSGLTFRDAAPLYLAYIEGRRKRSTLHTHAQRLRVLVRAPWAGKPLGRIEPRDIQAWLLERQAARQVRRRRPRRPGESVAQFRADPNRSALVTVPGTSGATLNRDLALVGALYRWAIRSGYCQENPAHGVERFSEKGRAREVYLTADEVRALLEACPDHLRPIVHLAAHSGARQGELRALQWRDVDLERGAFVVRPEVEKSGRGREVRLSAGTVAMLRDLKGRRPRPALDGADHVFLSSRGEPWSKEGVRAALESALRACPGIDASKRDRVTFHTLRHTAASLMAGAGTSLFQVGAVLGHSDPRTTKRYAHAAPDAGQAPIDALAERLAAPPPKGAERARRGA